VVFSSPGNLHLLRATDVTGEVVLTESCVEAFSRAGKVDEQSRAGQAGELFKRVADPDLPGGQYDDATADGLDVGQNVRAQQHGFSEIASQYADSVQHGDSFFRIQPAGGFIQNQQCRVMDDGHGKAQFLAHPGGIGFDGPIAFLSGAAEVQDFVTAANRFGGLHAGQSSRKLHGFDAGQTVDVTVILGHVSDLTANRGGVCAEWDTKNMSVSGGAMNQPEQHLDQCAFTGAVGSQQSCAAGKDLQMDIRQRTECAVVLGDSDQFDEW